MPACSGNFGLCILDGEGSSTERNPEPLEAFLQLEAGKLEELRCLSKADLFVEVIADHLDFEKIAGAVGFFAGCAKSEDPQKPVVEGIEKYDSLLAAAGNDGKLSPVHPV